MTKVLYVVSLDLATHKVRARPAKSNRFGLLKGQCRLFRFYDKLVLLYFAADEREALGKAKDMAIIALLERCDETSLYYKDKMEELADKTQELVSDMYRFIHNP